MSDYEKLEQILENLAIYLRGIRKQCIQRDLKSTYIPIRIDFVRQIEEDFISTVNGFMEDAWDIIKVYPKHSPEYMELKSLTEPLKAEFLARTFLNKRIAKKESGYNGHFMTIYYLFLEYYGVTTFAILMDQYTRRSHAAIAHVNRMPYLQKRYNALPAQSNIFSLGCGPAVDIMQYSFAPHFKELQFLLMDMEPDAIEFVSSQLSEHKNIEYRTESAMSIIKALKRKKLDIPLQDFIYCFGFFDYLSDTVIKLVLKGLFDYLKPGGALAVTNVSHDLKGRFWLETFLDWHLILRSQDEIRGWAEGFPEDSITIEYDPLNEANIYLSIQK